MGRSHSRIYARICHVQEDERIPQGPCELVTASCEIGGPSVLQLTTPSVYSVPAWRDDLGRHQPDPRASTVLVAK